MLAFNSPLLYSVHDPGNTLRLFMELNPRYILKIYNCGIPNFGLYKHCCYFQKIYINFNFFKITEVCGELKIDKLLSNKVLKFEVIKY